MRREVSLGCLAVALALGACDDPARPVPELGGGVIVVDSDPRGGAIFVDGNATGEVTPGIVSDLQSGARTIVVRLDTAQWVYQFADVVVARPDLDTAVGGPLTLRCTTTRCMLDAAEFHSAGNVRFVINAAGPQFIYQGTDAGVVWPSSTSNSYVAVGMPTFTATIAGTPVALGLRNVGSGQSFWAGRPLPEVLGTAPYSVRVPAWIAPLASTSTTVLRGLEVTQEIVVLPDHPNAILVRAKWRNISDDSLYHLLDPAGGVAYADAYLGFILDADVGTFGESTDDLVSYFPDRSLVFAYDGDFLVPGFSGGFSDDPGLVGLMLLEGPATTVALNTWPASDDFGASIDDADGRALLLATQSVPSNHEDARIGHAPDDVVRDYILSVVSGPFDLPPGDSASATFALLFASPVAGTFQSGTLLPAGDPLDAGRPLAAVVARLLALADSIIGAPPLEAP